MCIRDRVKAAHPPHPVGRRRQIALGCVDPHRDRLQPDLADQLLGAELGQPTARRLHATLERRSASGGRDEVDQGRTITGGQPHPERLVIPVGPGEAVSYTHLDVYKRQAPANRLADAVARYSDALGYAAEQTTGADLVQRLEQAADELVAGLPDAPAWPTLRAHLLLIAASGTDPVRALTEAVQARELGSAADPAAVLDWRLEPATGRRTQPGPLPWLPGLPTSLGLHRDWGDYLQRRHQLVGDLTDRVRTDALASTQLPAWAPAGSFRPDAATVADLTVWRAAHGTPATDTRPTGERQYAAVEARWQARLDRRIIDHLAPAAVSYTHLDVYKRQP